VQTLNRLLDLDEILYGGDGIEITSTTYYLITKLKSFQNGGRLNFWGWCNFLTDWWICMEAMALKITSTTYYFIPWLQPFQNDRRLTFTLSHLNS
jgi:hypothetical protein